MDLNFLFKGFIAGIVAGAPLGPIGVLCIRRILAKGGIVGFVSGLGVATADAVYGSIVALGITFIIDIIIGHKIWFCITAAIILSFLGIRTFFTSPHPPKIKVNEGKNLFSSYLSAFLITMTNPINILTFVAIFTVLEIDMVSGSLVSLWILSFCVFCGSLSWWIVLSSSIGLIQKKIDHNGIQWVNRIAGVILIIFAICTVAAYFLKK